MKSALESLEPTRVKITVEAPYEDMAKEIDAAYRTIANQISIPGFRKGKVPARIIDQRVGRGAVLEEAVNEVLPRFYREALTQTEARPLGQPEISVSEIPNIEGPLGGQLVFTAEVDVRPEITLPDFSTISVEVSSVEVDDAAVEDRLTALRERFGSLTTVERAVENDDFVVIDLTATIDGEEVDSVSGISYQVGSETMLPGLDEALLTANAGETRNFTAALAGGEHEGKDANVTVTVTEVKERELPEADDDFAQLASEFDTIGELRDNLREAVATDMATNQVAQAQGKLMDHLRETVEFPLPERVIEHEVTEHLSREGKEADDPHAEEVRNNTREILRDQLLMDEIADRLDVEVQQDELLQFLFGAAQRYGVDPTEFIISAEKNGQIPVFVAEVARTKGLNLVLRHVSIKDAAGADVDLSELIGTDSEDEAAKFAAAAEAAAKKPAAKKAPAKKAAAKKDDAEAEGDKPAKKPAAKKAPAKKAPAKKAETDKDADEAKPAAKKAPAKKAAAKKDDAEAEGDKPAKKPAAKKAAEEDKPAED